MTRIVPAILGALLAIATVQDARAQSASEPRTLSAQELQAFAPELRRGGYVLYFRHLDTAQDQEDIQPVDLNDCRKQRNLSESGIARGKAIASAFRKLRIPIGEVLSSPFCRTMETGRLVAGKATVDLDLFFAIALTREGKERKGLALRGLLARIPQGATNTLVIGHTANLYEAHGYWPQPEGVAYVFRPDGNGGAIAIARVTPETWSAAAR